MIKNLFNWRREKFTPTPMDEILQNSPQSERLQAEFERTNKKKIKKLSDAQLAEWQSKYPKESPQVIFADQLWKYRLAKHSAKFTLAISITSAIFGGVVGYYIKTLENKVTETKPNETRKQNIKPAVADNHLNNPKGSKSFPQIGK